MKSTCPTCGTSFRIDPSKIPAGGVQARCSRCGGIISIQAPAQALSASPAAEPRPISPAQAEGHAEPLPELQPRALEARPISPIEAEGHTEPLPELPPLPELQTRAEVQPRPEAPPPPAAVRAPAAATAPAAPKAAVAPAPPGPSPIFGKPDPHGKARRLARALVSDIAVYHPERRDRGLEQGTLRQEFREEIRKSWDEYVGQVGESLARSTPYFREALNEILAGGKTVF
jgi:predicted Zn finger-like uncharacterized protein